MKFNILLEITEKEDQMKTLEKTTTKRYLVDTCIILDDVNNLVSLYENGENAVIITDTVLNELDSKKTLLDDVGFNARSFFRAINGDNGKEYKTIKSVKIKNTDYCRKFKLHIEDGVECELYIISRNTYKDYKELGAAKNDMKIAEIAQSYSFPLVTNDIAFKMNALSMKIDASSLHKDEVNDNISNMSFKYKFEINTDKSVAIMTSLKDNEEFQNLKNWSQIEVLNTKTGQIFFGLKINGTFEEHNFDIINQQLPIQPKNAEQKYMFYSMINTENKITVAAGSTGSGKNVTSILAAIHMLHNPKKYDINGLVYLRNTVTANDKESELGFRKGGQDEKLNYFMYPLYSAINFILENGAKNSYLKNVKKSNENLDGHLNEDATRGFMEEHNIEVMDIAHARGITISNKIVIIDESQNMSNASMKLIGTRLGKGCRLFVFGDLKQIDHPYLSKNRNALATMLKKASESDFIAGIKLEKTIRSETAEWFDQNF
jgi:PhoH-like ATPase